MAARFVAEGVVHHPSVRFRLLPRPGGFDLDAAVEALTRTPKPVLCVALPAAIPTLALWSDEESRRLSYVEPLPFLASLEGDLPGLRFSRSASQRSILVLGRTEQLRVTRADAVDWVESYLFEGLGFLLHDPSPEDRKAGIEQVVRFVSQAENFLIRLGPRR